MSTVWVAEYGAVDGGGMYGIYNNREAAVAHIEALIRAAAWDGWAAPEIAQDSPSKVFWQGSCEWWCARLVAVQDRYMGDSANG